VQCLTIIGRVQRDRGDPEALKTFLSSLELAQKAQDSYQMALAHESLGSLLEAQERLPEALPHYQQELQLSTEPQGIGFAAVHFGNTLCSLGRLAEAGDAFDKAESNAERFPELRLNIARSRARLALARRHVSDAAGRCRRALAEKPPPGYAAQLTAILGLAQIGSGDPRGGLRNCEAARSMAAKLDDVDLRLEAQLAAAAARLDSGDPGGALALIHEIEPLLANRPLSHWHAMALAARCGRPKAKEYAATALGQLDTVARQWGPAAFQTYIARPDVQELRRSISHLVPELRQ
jgi:tetratricopeptide (TPR) repeat protein